MVTFVGIAARFVTNDIPIATIAALNNQIFDPDKITANKVIGVNTQP